jgi:von Willebrand factor type D domain
MSMKSESRIFNTLLRGAPALLLTLAYAGVAQAQPAPILDPPTCAAVPTDTIYRIEVGATPPTTSAPNPFIRASSLATWTFPSPASDTCTVAGSARTCAGMSVTLPGGSANQTPNFTGTATSSSQQVRVQATRSGSSCFADFTLMGFSGGGGWGDPHLTTVDGVHYDFQSAGEFTALREDKLVLQTRQSPVPTATVPITNPYTGITHCVAIFTAVAAKLGSSRVTVQPSAGAEPDPNSMQVRVNGKVVTLGDAPLVLHAGGNEKGAFGGTITKLPDGMFEIRDARGTQIVVTSAYWNARKVWYLNVNVYGTSAHQGTMGKLAERSWLPALPDGSSLGAKPASESDRYKALYEKFADAWRVTDATSLFDYEPGTNTATFTRDEWPRNHPESCAIDGQTSAQAATEDVAQQACANVVNATRKADCVFDVMVTGNAGFGKSYEVMQRFGPLPPGWYSPVPLKEPKCEDCRKCEDCPKPQPTEQPWWCCWTLIALGIVQLVLLVFLVLRALKKP